MFGLGAFAQLAFGQLVSFDPDDLSPVEASAADRLSAFNFCNPFDHVLPFTDGTIGSLDRAHLWGLSSGIAIALPAVPTVTDGPMFYRTPYSRVPWKQFYILPWR